MSSTTRKRRIAAQIRRSVREANAREALPGGLFGTYWKGGLHGREERRAEFCRRMDAELARAAALEAEAAEQEATGEG